MSEKVDTLLERGQWCLAIASAINIHEEGIAETAEMLMDGIIAYSTPKEEYVRDELLAILDKEEPNLIPYTFKELVEVAEQRLEIN